MQVSLHPQELPANTLEQWIGLEKELGRQDSNIHCKEKREIHCQYLGFLVFKKG